MLEDRLHDLREALRNQVPCEVTRSIRDGDLSDRMTAAKLVMHYLTGANAPDSRIELSVHFLRTVIRLMISYISELISDRVQRIAINSDECRILSLRSDMDDDSREVERSRLVHELSECDNYLRSLRRLESDLSRVHLINGGEDDPVLPMLRSASATLATYPHVMSIENVVERSLLNSRPCTGMAWMTENSFSDAGHRMQQLSRLIAYLFIRAYSLDSFFVGLHILRQSGQHVQKTQEAVYKDTTLKAVRDRITSHLSHRGFQPNKNLTLIETLYPNNCYWTELNRSWSRVKCFVTGPQGKIRSSSKPVHVPCDNVSDIPVELEKPSNGLIGSVSQEDSLTVMKCSLCQESSDAINHTINGGGYLIITVSWIERMTGREIARICMDGGGQAVDLEYAILHKDWRTVSDSEWSHADFESSVLGGHGEFLDRVIRHKALRSGFHPRSSNREELARVGHFLTSIYADHHSASFHIENLKWMLETHQLPQLALLYLRKYGLGQSEAEAKVLCDSVGPSLSFIAQGRLGLLLNQLPLTATENLAVWMTSHQLPPSESLDAIMTEFPSLEPICVPISAEISRVKIGDIFNVKSFKNDVSIRDLLRDVFPDLHLDSIGIVPDSGTSTSDPIDMIEYLTAQGRASMAFANYAPKVSAKALQKAARRVAMYNLFDDGIVASAVALLDLAGESTETLRVDVHCARTIAKSNSQESNFIRDMFLSLDKSQLLSALKLLEESAWATEPPIAAGDQPAARAELESPWHLVALFCRVHNLPRSLTLLHELARNGDWVMFLHESDIQQCPAETVRDVVQLYFDSKSPLRSHLNILLDVPPVLGASVLSAALGDIISGDGMGWLDRHMQQTDSLVVRERHEKIFNDGINDEISLQKCLNLFQFQRAKVHVDNLVRAGRPRTDVFNTSVAWDVNNEALEMEISRLRDEPVIVGRQKLTSNRTSLLKNSKRRSVVQHLTLVEVERIFVSGSFDTVRISNTESVELLVNVVLNHGKLTEWSDLECEEVTSVVHEDHLELLGDLLRARCPVDHLARGRILEITHYAYAKGFVDQGKFSLFLEERALHRSPLQIPDDRRLHAIRKERCADDLLAQSTRGDEMSSVRLIDKLGDLVVIAEAYAQLGKFRKHIDTAREAFKICNRISQIGIVL